MPASRPTPKMKATPAGMKEGERTREMSSCREGGIEGGPDEPDHPDGQSKPQQRQSERLTEELQDQLPALGTNDLSDTDFGRAVSRSGGGQVHEVDTGDHEHKDAYGGEDINVANVARLRDPPSKRYVIRPEVTVGKRVQI